MKLGIIIPAYNEEKRIGKTLECYIKFFNEMSRQKKFDCKILVVINGTTDNTRLIVKEIIKKQKIVDYLNFEQGGKGFAIIEGFKEFLKEDFDLIGFVDADMATSPESFYELVKNIKGYDGIIGSRWMKKSVVSKRVILRTVMSRGFNFIVRSLFLINYNDTQCGVKIFKRKIIEELTPKVYSTEWAFDVNLLYLCKKHKFKIKEYPTIWEDQKNSKIEIIKTPIQMFAGVVRLRLMHSVFEPLLRPIKFILLIGDKLINKK